VGGFRAFGRKAQRLDFSAKLAVIAAPNSQGKTSLVEAIEFLLTGKTVRRELFGSAKAEFSGCLRNVHLPPGCVPFVKAGIGGADGEEHTVERRLTADYTPQSDCESQLFIDSRAATSLDSIGFVLADPPLSAPVLLQHTIRFLLSTTPQARADYFKAVLEVQDLELVRDEVARLAQTLADPQSDLLDALARCCSELPAVEKATTPLRGKTPVSLERVRGALVDAISGVLATLAGTAPGTAPLAAGTDAMRALLNERRQSTFPGDALAPSAAVVDFVVPQFSGLASMSGLAAKVERETQAITALFEAVLDVPGVADATSALDCPVCLTRGGLSPSRVRDIATHVRNRMGWTQARRKAEEELKSCHQDVTLTRSRLATVKPKAAGWSQADRDRHRAEVADLCPAATSLYEDYLVALDGLSEKCRAADGPIAELLATVTDFRKRTAEAQPPIDFGDLLSGCEPMRIRTAAATQAADACRIASGALTDALRQAIDARSSVSGWEDLLHVAESPQGLLDAVIDRRAVDDTRADITKVVAEIDKAKAKVLDERFGAMSDEISRWWLMLRPEEPVNFCGVKRRGTGRRYLDFKAALYPAIDDNHCAVERDAVGVFSDSQLNALGLSAFLARCCRHKTPFIVLDDPVPASDADHEATFSDSVVSALLADGLQVIVSTHDEKLRKLLADFHQAQSPDMFSMTLIDPKQGPVITKTSDCCDAMLANAQPFLRNQNPEIRKEGSHRLRDAAERLCKDIAVKGRRKAGESCSLVDYDSQTLKPLISAAEPYLTQDPAHVGKLRAIGKLLSPGAHDAPTPRPNDLWIAYGNLKEIKKAYV
jgi:hypothetical protein